MSRGKPAGIPEPLNPDRIVYPVAHFTLRDVFTYYTEIAPVLLPHLAGHPVTLKRYPDQADGVFFYEKDAPAFTPAWVKTFGVWRRSGEGKIRYIVIEDLRTLQWAASVGTLEIHPFLAKEPDIQRPAGVVFDLDPGEGATIIDCCQVALLLRELLERLNLAAFAKVSGSKGLQVCVPLNTPASYAATQPFARTTAQLLEQEHPQLIISDMERARRKGKVFIDWSQNADYKTTVSVYSLRAKRRHPYVSTPVTWDEVSAAIRKKDPKGLDFSPQMAIERVRGRGDLFAPVLQLGQELPEAFARRTGRSSGKARKRANREPQLRASAQGGRRRFLLSRAGGAANLIFELHDELVSFRLRKGLPQKGSMPAERKPSPNQSEFESRVRDSSATAVGEFDLIEGNLKKGYLRVFLAGKKVRGEWVIAREGQGWSVLSSVLKNSFVQPAKRPAAKSSDWSLKLRGPRSEPRFMEPMECKLVRSVPTDDHWTHELKLDGYRAIAVKNGTRAEIYSRYGNPFSSRFPAICEALANSRLPDCTLDGEIVALDASGRPSFQELQNSRRSERPIIFYIFDVLNYDGRDLTDLPLTARKEMLNAMSAGFRDPVRLAVTFDADASNMLAEIRRLGLEGLVSKRSDSRYEVGKRTGAWVKFRLNEREEFVIGGYLPWTNTFEALLVGQFDGKKLMFKKKLRNGFTPANRPEVFAAIKDGRISRSPFANLPEPHGRRGAVTREEMSRYVWVEPKVECEVEFAEWTKGGRLRHAEFRQLV